MSISLHSERLPGKNSWRWLATVGVLLLASCQPIAPAEGQEAASNLQAIPTDSIEPLAQGPIHEAFAELIPFNSTAPENLVTKAPPAAVEELPPAVRPEGRNVQWIPGYWDWSDERSDFIWISGVWRDSPPGKRWVPGYWAQMDGGYQWTSGMWVDQDAESLRYLPHPPDTLDEGPTTEAPGDNYFWIPGCWQWRTSRYLWQPGFWSQGYNNWVWTPSHYRYTPRGSVYCGGYWDYTLGRRGWLFAPVAFRGGYYNRGYYYTPRNLVDAALLTGALFVGPNYRHYYYGDYYGRRGFEPWFAYHLGRRGYDPFFAYDSWRYGSRNRDWYDRLARDYRDGRRGGDARQGRSAQDIAADINRFRREAGEPEYRRGTSLVRPLDKAIQENRGGVNNVVRLGDSQRRAAAASAQRYRALTQGRLEGEGKDRSDLRAGRDNRGDAGQRRTEVGVPLPKDSQPRQFRLPDRQPSERTAQPRERDGERGQVERPATIDRGPDRDRGAERRYEVQRPPQRGTIERGGGDRTGGDREDVVRGGADRSGERGAVERGGGDRGVERGGGDRGGAVQRGGEDRGGVERGGVERGGGDRGGSDRGGGGGGNRGGGRGGRR